MFPPLQLSWVLRIIFDYLPTYPTVFSSLLFSSTVVVERMNFSYRYISCYATSYHKVQVQVQVQVHTYLTCNLKGKLPLSPFQIHVHHLAHMYYEVGT